MLKIIGTEKNGEIADEKVILDDNNKPTSTAWKILGVNFIINLCLFTTIFTIMKFFKKK